jgi:hypothetical protein
MASMEDRFSSEIVELEWSHQMWNFLRSCYEPTGQYTFLATIFQEQLLRRGDDTVDAFFDQLSVFCVRLTLLVLNCLLPLASHARIRSLLLSFVTHMSS